MTNDTEASNISLRNEWLSHMTLDRDLRSERAGVQVRAIPSLDGCDYLEPGVFTNAASYVFGPLIKRLVAEGYESGKDLDAATYDWRLAPKDLEERDAYFTKTIERIENMRIANEGRKVALLAHSMGCVCAHYLLNFAASLKGRDWIDDNIECFIPAGAPHLGASETLRSVILGNNMGLPSAFLQPKSALIMGRSLGSTPWLLPSSSEGHVESAVQADAANESGTLGDMVCCALVRKESLLRVTIREADVRTIASRHPQIECLRIKVAVGNFVGRSRWFRPRSDSIVTFIKEDNSSPADVESTSSGAEFAVKRTVVSHIDEVHPAEGTDGFHEEKGAPFDDDYGDNDDDTILHIKHGDQESEPESAQPRFLSYGAIFEVGLPPDILAENAPDTPISIQLEEKGLLSTQQFGLLRPQSGMANSASFCGTLYNAFLCCLKSICRCYFMGGELVTNFVTGDLLDQGLPMCTFSGSLKELLGNDYVAGTFLSKNASLNPVVLIQRLITRVDHCECQIGFGLVWSDPTLINRSAQVTYPEHDTPLIRRKGGLDNLSNVVSGGYKQYCPADMLKLEGTGVARNLDLWQGESFQLDPHVSPSPPPVSKVHAIFGTNVPTEVSAVFKRHARPVDINSLQSKYVLDTKASLEADAKERTGFTMRDGKIFETRNSPQRIIGTNQIVQCCGDGTVPYSSLQHVRTWAPYTDLSVEELPGVEHRAMLNSPAFHEAVLKQVIPSFGDDENQRVEESESPSPVTVSIFLKGWPVATTSESLLRAFPPH